MDFINRANRAAPNQPQAVRPTAPPESVTLPTGHSKNDKGQDHGSKEDIIVIGTRVAQSFLLFIVALLIATVVWLIYSTTPSSEGKYVDPNKLQAVFLNTGQVYFGDLQALNKDYFVLTNIYYLQSSGNQSNSNTTNSSNQQVSLVKLGCELHMPYDRMIVNANEVTFWENLQSDGQVAKAVAQYQKQNPSGQKCSDQAQAPNTNSLQSQTTNGTGTSTKP